MNMNYQLVLLIIFLAVFIDSSYAQKLENSVPNSAADCCDNTDKNLPKACFHKSVNKKSEDDTEEKVLHAAGCEESDLSESERVESGTWLGSSLHWITETQEYVSVKVQSAGINIDRYISRDSFDELEANESYLRLRLLERLAEGGDHVSEARISGKFDLPNSKQKVKLIFDTDPDDFDSIEQKQRDVGIGTQLFDKKKNEATIGLSLEEVLLDNWKMSLGGGVRLRSVLDPYTRLRFTRYKKMNENWTSRARETIFYFDSDGWGAETEFDFYRPLDGDRLLHVSLGGKYLDSENNWEWVHGLSLNRRLNRNNAIEYQFGVSVNSNPTIQVSNYWLRSKWQHRLFKDWLYFNVVPEVAFPRNKSFSSTFQVNFELELYFSKDPELRNRRIRY